MIGKIKNQLQNLTVNQTVGEVWSGKIKCAAIWGGLWVALQLFLFCEGIAKRLCRNFLSVRCLHEILFCELS